MTATRPQPAEQTHGPSAAGIKFAGIATRLVEFNEITDPPPQVMPTGLGPGESAVVTMDMTVGFQLGESTTERLAEVTLDATFIPDPTRQPYRVRVVVSGLFKTDISVPLQPFQEFCRKGAPTVIWPYMRGLVSAITADARFGPLRLDPIHLAAAIGDQNWHEAVIPAIRPSSAKKK